MQLLANKLYREEDVCVCESSELANLGADRPFHQRLLHRPSDSVS